MKINYKHIALAVLSAILIVWVVYLIMQSQTDKPFNKVNLSYKNYIKNDSFPKYYDTILSVGLDNIDIMGIDVELYQISEATKSKFEGLELKAHLRYYEGTYYLFVDKWDREEAFNVLSHELIHIMQYHSGILSYKDGMVTWQKSNNLSHYEQYDLNNTEYDIRPWEDDAFKRQGDMEASIRDVLY